MAKRFIYSDDHLRFLSEGYKKMSATDLTIDFNAKFNLNKSAGTIKATMKNHGITCGRKGGQIKKGKPISFTAEQKEWFIKNYPLYSRRDLVEKFNLQFNQNKGLIQVVSFLKNHGIKSGRNGCFKKGQACWSKGTKGLLKANKGSWKKGNKSHNWVPLGSERIVKGGYVEVKTAEPHVWTQKHRMLWQQHHGPIPPDHKVRFKDNNPANITIDNLFMVNNSEHQLLNNMDFKNHADEHKETVLLIAKVRSKALAIGSKEKNENL